MTNRKSFTGFPTSYRWSAYVTCKSSICTLLPVSGFIPIRQVAGPSVNSCIVEVRYSLIHSVPKNSHFVFWS